VKDATRPAIFKWRQTAPELILCAVRWYFRYSLSLRDVEEFAERGLEADHTTIWRWVQRYGPELEQRLRRQLKPTNKSWRVDETYIRVQGRWCYLYRAIDSTGGHNRLPAVGVTRCRGGQAPVPPSAQRFIASAAPRYQH
jgi:transposase, IS6 family